MICSSWLCVEACQEEYVGIPIFVTSEIHHGLVQSYRHGLCHRYLGLLPRGAAAVEECGRLARWPHDPGTPMVWLGRPPRAAWPTRRGPGRLGGYTLKAGHLMTSSTERHGLLSFPRPGQVIDLR